MSEKSLIYDKKIELMNKNTGQCQTLSPIAFESCMEPGKFHITPLEISEDEKEMRVVVKEQELVVSKADIEAGKIELMWHEFAPEIVRRRGACKPCTNCGRCSW